MLWNMSVISDIVADFPEGGKGNIYASGWRRTSFICNSCEYHKKSVSFIVDAIRDVFPDNKMLSLLLSFFHYRTLWT